MQRVAIIHSDRSFMEQLEQQLWNVCNVSMYFDGKTFLQNMSYNAPDVIFMDESLPDLKADQLVEKIRARGIETPVVLYVTSRALWSKTMGVREGALELVSKGQGSFGLACRKLYSLLWVQKRGAIEKARASKIKFKWFLRSMKRY